MMTLPSSGALSMSAINAEFGRGNNLNAYRGTTWYTDAGGSGTFSSGAISFSEFYGKRLTAPTFSFTISSSQTNANLRTLAVNAGWNQSAPVVATISSGVTLSSTKLSTPGLTINGSFPNGVQLVNNGTIVGRGGAGGAGGTTAGGSAGSAGTVGLSVSVAVTITNNGTIAGGGGGGGGGGASYANTCSGDYYGAGGGGGGGAGNGSGAGNGGSGTLTDGGGGGAGTFASFAGTGGAGGSGGSRGASGNAGATVSFGRNGGSGGGGGAAVSGNANISWAATGTRLGAIT